MPTPISHDAVTVAKALIDLEAFLGDHLQSGDKDADETLHKIINLLDRTDVVAAAEHIIAGCGLRVVKLSHGY